MITGRLNDSWAISRFRGLGMMPLPLHEILVLQVVLTTITVLFCWTVSSSSKGKVVCKLHGDDDDDDPYACWLGPTSVDHRLQKCSLFLFSQFPHTAPVLVRSIRYEEENGRKWAADEWLGSPASPSVSTSAWRISESETIPFTTSCSSTTTSLCTWKKNRRLYPHAFIWSCPIKLL